VPVVGVTVVASVLLGLVSTGTVVWQAVVLAHLLAGAMARTRDVDVVGELTWLAAAVVLRGAVALGGEFVARIGAAATRARLRRLLLSSMVVPGAAGRAPAPGTLAVLAGRGLDALDVFVGRYLGDLVLAVVAPVALAAAAGAMDWLSGIVLGCAIVLFPLFGALVGRTSMGLANRRWHQLETLGRQVADVFLGLPVLRALGRASTQRARIERANEALRAASLRSLRLAFLSGLVLDTLASVSVALVAVPLGIRLLEGSVHLSAALGVLIVAPEVFVPLRRASAEFHDSTEGLAALSEVLAVVGDRPTGDTDWAEVPGAPRVGQWRTMDVPDPTCVPVALRAVGVDLPGRTTPVLAVADLVIDPGETVVVVGANGSGKSTLGALVLGMRAPSRGQVTVGDADLGDLDLARWRERVAYLPEHPVILAGTLAENLRLACPSASEAAMRDAMERVGGGGFLDRFPAGLHTVIGDGGRPLSAGERQRIALARVLLRPASFYVLDEPTVHLERDAERCVVGELQRVLRGRSALIVTHSPVVLELADRVVRLADGHIVPVSPGGSRRTPSGDGAHLDAPVPDLAVHPPADGVCQRVHAGQNARSRPVGWPP